MTHPDRLAGEYLLGLEPMLISVAGPEVTMRLAGVPASLAARLIGSDGSYVVSGSQFDGATIEFADGDPSPGGRVGAVIDFVRAPGLDPNAPGKGLRLPDLTWTDREEAAYRGLTQRIMEARARLDIDSLHQWPKWRFVEWLTRQDQFIFHGSPLADLERFQPRRHSVEIMDQGGTGNRAAVYGTPYGLWATWFAVIDRDKITGTIRSGVSSWADASGDRVDLYNFTVNEEQVGEEIWRTGSLYILPRKEFGPIPFYPGGPPSNEWASPSEVAALARITVEPADFPFLAQVGGHDDGELIAAEALAAIVDSRVTGARLVPGGVIISLAWDEEIAGAWDDYMANGKRFQPDVDRIVTTDPDGFVTVELRGPEGYLQAYQGSLMRHGIRVEP